MAIAVDEAALKPPEGFEPFVRRGPFTTYNGPFWRREVEGGVSQGFYVLRRHCNGMGLVHGGMLASFLDGMVGNAVYAALQRPAVTIHLSLDYLAMARTGDWVEGEARLTRATRDVAFAEARAFVGERDVVRASAIFKLMEPRNRTQR